MSSDAVKSPGLAWQSLLWRTLISLGLGAFFLWLAVRSLVREGDGLIEGAGFWEAVLSSAQAVGWGPLLIYVLFFVALHVFRSLRWVVQVRPLAPTLPLSWIFRICVVGYAAIILLPLRLGEFMRPLLLSRGANVSFVKAMGTAVVERIFDGLLVTLMLFLALAFSPLDVQPVVRSAGYISLLIFLGAGGGTALFVFRPAVARWLVDQTFGRVSRGVAEKLNALLEEFAAGLGSMLQEGTWRAFLLFSVLYWFTNGLGIWYLAGAFGFDLPLVGAFAAMAVLVVGIMVPAGPGFLGNFQFFLAAGLSLWVSTRDAPAAVLSFALVLNFLQFATQVLFAAPFLMQHLRDPAPRSADAHLKAAH